MSMEVSGPPWVVRIRGGVPVSYDKTDGQLYADGSPVSGAGNRVAGVPVGLLGDSITQENYDQTASQIQERARWFPYANALLGQRLRLVNNAGVSGETTAQMLARIGSSAGLGVGFGGIGAAGTAVTTSPSPLNGSPKYVFVHAGVNDIYGFNLTAATVTANLQQIYQTLIANGVTPIVMTIMAVNSTTVGYSTANVATHLAVNDWIRNYAAANGLLLVDAFAATVDPNSGSVEMNTAFTRDGKQHPNNRGGMAVARAIYGVLNNIIPARDVLPQSNAAVISLDASIRQLLPVPLLTGTAAITATGYSGNTAGSNLGNANFVRGGTPTCVLSAVARADGFGQNTKMVATFGAANDSLEIRFPSQHATAVVGATYVAVCEVTVTGPAGAALAAADNFQGAQLYLQYNDGTTNFFTYALGRGSTDTAMVGSFTVTLMTPPLTIPASGTPTTFRPNFTIFGSGAGSPEVQIGRVGLIRIA